MALDWDWMLARNLGEPGTPTRRIIEWLDDPNRKPADLAFTAGPLRQIAYRIEDLLRYAPKPWPMQPDSEQWKQSAEAFAAGRFRSAAEIRKKRPARKAKE